MARLIPNLDPSDITNPGERKLAEHLVAQLPASVDVFHSFHWLGTNRRGALLEGECDFVVLDPDHGLLVVEVKGGPMRYDRGRDRWIRGSNGRETELTKDPFAQARSSMHEILTRVRRNFPNGGNDLPLTFGHAVAFPDCRFEGAIPASATSELILDAKKCEDLAASVPKALGRFQRRDHPRLDAAQIERVHEALYPEYSLVPVTWRRVEDQALKLRRLTADQERILDVLASHEKAAIRGVAGSGKTLLAMAKAQAMAREGLRTLLLCYNKPLKAWLEQSLPERYQDLVVVDNYHGLVDELCRKADVPFWGAADPSTPEFWASHAPDCLVQALGRLDESERFDAIVVDEGQDFRELWFTSLEAAFRDPSDIGCFYVFFDPNQSLFVDEVVIPEELGTPFDLPVNCRNTIEIAEHCSNLVHQPSRVRPDAPRGDEPELLEAPDLRQALRAAGKKVRQWCMPNAGGLGHHQVAVLTSSPAKEAWPKDFGPVPLTKNFDQWRQGKGVLLATWCRFKGLEADAIVVVEPRSGDDRTVEQYVARSRARHLLCLIEHDGPEGDEAD